MFLSPQNKSLVAVATQRSQQGLTLFAGEGGQGRCGSRRVFLVSVSLESQSLFARCPEFVASQLKAGGEMSSIIRFVVLLQLCVREKPICSYHFLFHRDISLLRKVCFKFSSFAVVSTSYTITCNFVFSMTLVSLTLQC